MDDLQEHARMHAEVWDSVASTMLAATEDKRNALEMRTVFFALLGFAESAASAYTRKAEELDTAMLKQREEGT